jgi:uncharacterized membrane protein YiaA
MLVACLRRLVDSYTDTNVSEEHTASFFSHESVWDNNLWTCVNYVTLHKPNDFCVHFSVVIVFFIMLWNNKTGLKVKRFYRPKTLICNTVSFLLKWTKSGASYQFINKRVPTSKLCFLFRLHFGIWKQCLAKCSVSISRCSFCVSIFWYLRIACAILHFLCQ